MVSGNTTKADDIKARATAAQPTLDSLTSNSTLMTNCAVIDAAQKEEDMCQETFALQAFVKFAANETAVASKTNNNATKIADIQLKASQAAAKLDILTSNSTLQAACPAVMQKDTCKFMDGLMKFIATAKNQTKLDEITKGNTTKEDKIKAEATKAQTRLAELQNNATLVSACNALNAQADKGTTESSTNSISSTNTKSAAMMLQLPGVASAVLSTIVVVAAGMFML
jgi:hypothetical protein